MHCKCFVLRVKHYPIRRQVVFIQQMPARLILRHTKNGREFVSVLSDDIGLGRSYRLAS